MLPPSLRSLAKSTLARRKAVKLAVFGPGRHSPYFLKRQLTVETIRQEHPTVQIDFYMIDDRLGPISSYEDYVGRLLPEELGQIEWADIVLFLVLHQRGTVVVEFALAREVERRTGKSMMQKCGIAISEAVLRQLPAVWAFEARRLLDGSSRRIITFGDDELASCRLAKDMALQLFESVAIEMWADIS